MYSESVPSSAPLLSSSTTAMYTYTLGAQFVSAYYQALANDTDTLYQFYEDDSGIMRVEDEAGAGSAAGPAGVSESVGQVAIHAKVTSMGYAGCKVKVESTDIMGTDNGALLLVSGIIATIGAPARQFVQTFLLLTSSESQGRYFVRNDILRLLAPITVPVVAATAPVVPTKTHTQAKVAPKAHKAQVQATTVAAAAPVTTTPAATVAVPTPAATVPTPVKVQRPTSKTIAPSAGVHVAAPTKEVAAASAPVVEAKVEAKPIAPIVAPVKAAVVVAKPTAAVTPAAKPAAAPVKPSSWASRLAPTPAGVAPVTSPTGTTAPIVQTPIVIKPITAQRTIQVQQQPLQQNGASVATHSSEADDGFKTVGRSLEKKSAPRTQGQAGAQAKQATRPAKQA